MPAFPSQPPAPPIYRGRQLDRIAFPLGGIGAGSVCLGGTGALTAWSIRNRPDLHSNLPMVAVLALDGHADRVLEAPVPPWRLHHPWGRGFKGTGQGGEDLAHGLRRCRGGAFTARFPLAELELEQPDLPVQVRLSAWSPFIAGDTDASSLPVAVLEYTVANRSAQAVRGEFAWHARNLLGGQETTAARGDGFVLAGGDAGRPWERVAVRVACAQAATVDCAWPVGSWCLVRAIPSAWLRARTRANREHPRQASTGGSLFAPLALAPGESATITVLVAWHAPGSDVRCGHDDPPCADAAERHRRGGHRPWYAGRYDDVDAVVADLQGRLPALRARTRRFADALHAATLPAPVLEAVTANLGILRSPTVLRQADGRLWAWEGSHDDTGSCHGSCTHVWNYAQAVAHLFPELERGLRDTEFGESQDAAGHQNFRSALPIRTTDHTFHAAADGQLGGIVKLWRDWQISGDTAWLRRLWPQARASLAYCIGAWDPDRTGALVEPHHNTYDIEFWGPDGMCGSIYAAALKAAAAMAAAVGDDPAPWRELAAKAAAHLDGELFRRGRYVQRVMRATPRTGDASRQAAAWNVSYSPEALRLLEAEGPKYQYGDGVLSDGVIGAWMAEVSGLGSPLAPAKVKSHLAQVHRHNLKRDLRRHANPQRPTYAIGDEGGLLLCSWPDGGKPSLPFVYSDEVWTGIEYQVASHCIMAGLVDEGLDIVRTARARYDGSRRNPFDEYECGHWYARALASWALLPALSGVRYSAADRTLWIAPKTAKRPYRAYLGSGGSFGTITLGKSFISVDLASGALALDLVVIDGRTVHWGVRAEAGTAVRLELGRTRARR